MEITRISDGELNIRLFHANELVSAFESFDVVQSGTCQMGFGSPTIGQVNLHLYLFFRNSVWNELPGNEFLVLQWRWYKTR